MDILTIRREGGSRPLLSAQAHADLHVAHRTGHIEDLSGRPGNNCGIRQGQVLMIEYIECFPAELQVEPFGHSKVLGQ